MAKPCGYRLTVKPDNIEDLDPAFKNAKKAGILVLDQDKEREQSAVDTGVILEIGPDCWKDFDAPWAKVGDRIAYAKYAGKAIKQKEGRLLVINDEDVVAVLGEQDE